MVIPLIVAAVIITAGLGIGVTYQHYTSQNNVLSDGTELPQTQMEKPDYNPETIAFLIHQKVNEYRLANNRTALSYDYGIETIAKAHADDMINRNYFSHYSPEGKDASQRGIENGFEVCGDVTPTQIEIDYKTKHEKFKKEQDKNNAEIRQLNQKIKQYNTKIDQLNHDANTRDDIRDFMPSVNQKQLNDELVKLQAEYDRLQAKSRQLDADYEELKQLYSGAKGATTGIMQFAGLSENISQSNLWLSRTEINGIPYYDWLTNEGVANDIVQGWINSPGHNENMLTPHFTKEGLGVSIDSEYEMVYAVQNFC
jgi:uncharacterized protein YkwD/prefoldin subunit 5